MGADLGETWYLIANASVAPVWLLLILAPRAALTERVAATPLVPAIYALVYVGLLVPALTGGSGDMASLEGLRAAFEQDAALLLAWVHYLCFDMAVGMWAYREGRRLGMSWWVVGPCLAGTLMFGPAGFVAFVAARRLMTGVSAWA